MLTMRSSSLPLALLLLPLLPHVISGRPDASMPDPAEIDAPAASPTSPQGAPGPLDPLDLMTVCSKTRDMAFCMAAVQSAATWPITTTNAAMVLNLAVNATIVNANTAADAAYELARVHDLELQTPSILINDCAPGFTRAAKKLQGAAAAIARGDRVRMSECLAVTVDLLSCDRAFAEANLPRMMEDVVEDLRGLAAMNLGIAKVYWPDPLFEKEYNYALLDM